MEPVMNHLQRKPRLAAAPPAPGSRDAAVIYNQAGSGYVTYADGNPDRPFAFEGLHAYADRQVWHLLDSKLQDLRMGGATSIRILDAGCGPGTWLRRLVTHARYLGFTEIRARGFDVAEAQIEAAQKLAGDIAALPGVDLAFEVGHLADRLPEADGSVDITLCLYSVLSHLPVAELPGIAAEFARVTRGHVITTVRSIGSTPTVFVAPLEKARFFRHDNECDRCEIELDGGQHFSVGFHLFSASELEQIFGMHFQTEDLRGLDLFHTRFLPDPRWNPAYLAADHELLDELAQLEEAHARDPEFMERATHLLLVGRPRRPRIAMQPPLRA
jgi:SAM-dependent methyltransferase